MPDHEATPMENVLLGWARDAAGDSQRFTGDDIYGRAGHWCMDRLRRDIPTIATYYCRVRDAYFTISIALVPEQAIPLGVRLRRPDETVTLGDLVLLAYKMPEEA